MAKPDYKDFDCVNVPWVKDLLGISTATVNRYIDTEQLPRPRKLGRARFWVKSELIEYIMARSQND